jgi:hypothetical protein
MPYDNPVDVDVFAQPVFQQDKRLHVRFYRRAVKQTFKSEQEGRAIYKDVDYVQIHVPGDRNTMIDTEANFHYQQRWPEQWKRYKDGMDQAVVGTPLDSLPGVTPSQTAELKAMHVHTVEQLAEMADQLAQKMMGNFALREKARKFLDASKGVADQNKRDAELAERDDRIKALEEQIAMIAAERKVAAVKATPAK